MALFTDSPAIDIVDLTAYESSILETANAEGIDLTVKIGLAKEEAGAQLESLTELDGVVVTAPLRLWQLFHTLALVYRDAYHSQLNDRYRGKWQEYRGLARWASELLFQVGIGYARDPIPEAEAPQLSAAIGALAAGTYFARTSWLNAAGEEGSAGKLASLDLTAGSTLQAAAVNAPANAVAWNIYAGIAPLDLFLQNATPLSVGASWTAAGALLAAGKRPGGGQSPNYTRPAPRVLRRG